MTTQTQHTPGPWDVTLSRYYVYDRDGNIVASCDHKDIGRLDERKANALLIAAAPDLLAALTAAEGALADIINAAGNGQAYTAEELARLFMSAHETARAAIARATVTA